MEYRNILSSANSLKKNSLYKITIAESTQELLYRINTAIMNAHDAGLSKIEFKLPMNFKQLDNNIKNKEVQVPIYYNIISELEKKGYEVKLHYSLNYTLIIISWTIKSTDSELDEMIRKLDSIRITK